MFLKKITDKLISKMQWYDVGLLKWTVLFFTLFLLTVWDSLASFLLGIAWYWYLLLSLATMAPLLKKMF